jgi:hypothetical protein
VRTLNGSRQWFFIDGTLKTEETFKAWVEHAIGISSVQSNQLIASRRQKNDGKIAMFDRHFYVFFRTNFDQRLTLTNLGRVVIKRDIVILWQSKGHIISV